MSKREGEEQKVPLTDVIRHPERTLRTQIQTQQTVASLQVPLISEAGLAQLIGKLTDGPVALKPPIMRLSARAPWDAAGNFLEMYRPGRWDTSTDQVYMDPFVVPNPAEPGVWTGSVGYITFHPPATGLYVIVVHFYGWDISLRLFNLKSSTTAVSNSNTPTAAATLFNATGGTPMEFQIICTGIYLGFVQNVQVFQLS